MMIEALLLGGFTCGIIGSDRVGGIYRVVSLPVFAARCSAASDGLCGGLICLDGVDGIEHIAKSCIIAGHPLSTVPAPRLVTQGQRGSNSVIPISPHSSTHGLNFHIHQEALILSHAWGVFSFSHNKGNVCFR